MSIAVILAMAAQVMQGPAGPITTSRPATGWSCDVTDLAGARFTLRGVFPEAPAGWLPNDDLPTVIEGDGPEVLRGRKGVRSFGEEDGARAYQVSLSAPEGVRYNLNFALRAGPGGTITITRYTPVGNRGRLDDFARGQCTADFNPPAEVKAIQ